MPVLSQCKWVKVEDPAIKQKIFDFEQQSISTKYKVGVLYVKDGQTDENDMFSNGGEEPPSAEFEEFIDFLGDRVVLCGFEKFKGGLDVKANTTGHESVYTTFSEQEIMVGKNTFCLNEFE